MKTGTQNFGHTSNSVWADNPILVQLLGLSPLLASSTSAITGTSLGLITAIVCLAATSIHVQLQNQIQAKWRFVWYLFLTSVLTSLIDISLKLKLLALHRELGIYLPLVASNFVILMHLEKVNIGLQKPTKEFSLKASCDYCIGIVVAMVIFSCIREIIGYGTLFHDWGLITPAQALTSVPAISRTKLLGFSLSQPGAYMLLGFFLAFVQFVRLKIRSKENIRKEEIVKVTRIRVTEKI
ncbi:MAG: Rnf-Nqr domain containing protein [Pseudohongiellaceae bacterium]